MFGIIERDEQEAAQEAREISAEARAAAAEAREKRVDGRINAFLAPVYGGKKTVAQARSEMLAYAFTIRDREERQLIMGSSLGELDKIEGLRISTPAYIGGMERIDAVVDRLSREVPHTPTRRIPSGQPAYNRDAHVAAIVREGERMKVQIGRKVQNEGVDPTPLYDQAERQITDAFLRLYPR